MFCVLYITLFSMRFALVWAVVKCSQEDFPLPPSLQGVPPFAGISTTCACQAPHAAFIRFSM